MTSSPGPISSASSTSTSASVPFATPIVCFDAEVGGRLLLERVVVRPADELAAVEHLAEAGLELGDQRLVLGMDVNERDRHGASL